jgi:hypothetical protein
VPLRDAAGVEGGVAFRREGVGIKSYERIFAADTFEGVV